jgi:hypothetical protein
VRGTSSSFSIPAILSSNERRPAVFGATDLSASERLEKLGTGRSSLPASVGAGGGEDAFDTSGVFGSSG